MRTTLRSAWRWTTLALLAGLALPLALSAQTAPIDLGQAFKDADRNGDGRLDREEFRLLMIETFYFRDTNRDGYLVVTEVSQINPEIFRNADTSGDGRLSLQEYIDAALKDFENADADRNGGLDLQELHIYVRATRR
jgi:hypothetical protein